MLSLHRRMHRTLGILNSCLGPLAGRIFAAACSPLAFRIALICANAKCWRRSN
jgi:hypothetical protein